MRKIYLNFFPRIRLGFACLYRNLQEKIGNNYDGFVNMTLKIVKYHKASTYLNLSKA